MEKVAKTDIKDGFITFRQQKTNTKVVIPLHPVVLEILEKYDYSPPRLPTLMIMSISGHKTEKSFLKYIKVKQSEHAEMMKEAWKNIYK